jgi:hypothetical protein|tara:strand:+ start:288 stop:458 length:171 start_codon:yes stop_codon:yes gene_type:complete
MNKIGALAEIVEETLLQEKKNLEAYDPMHNDPDMHNCEGWCEALQFVLRQIEVIVE